MRWGGPCGGTACGTGRVHADGCTVRGAGASECVAGEPSGFSVFMRDRFGNPCDPQMSSNAQRAAQRLEQRVRVLWLPKSLPSLPPWSEPLLSTTLPLPVAHTTTSFLRQKALQHVEGANLYLHVVQVLIGALTIQLGVQLENPMV